MENSLDDILAKRPVNRVDVNEHKKRMLDQLRSQQAGAHPEVTDEA